MNVIINTDYSETIKQFEQLIDQSCPKMFKKVFKRQSFLGNYLGILIACSDHKINSVDFQYPQLVSFCFDLDTQVLTVQSFGASGGNHIYTDPIKNKYLAMEAVKIPFRKSQGLPASLRNLEGFLKRYKQALKDNIEILRYRNFINYEELIK